MNTKSYGARSTGSPRGAHRDVYEFRPKRNKARGRRGSGIGKKVTQKGIVSLERVPVRVSSASVIELDSDKEASTEGCLPTDPISPPRPQSRDRARLGQTSLASNEDCSPVDPISPPDSRAVIELDSDKEADDFSPVDPISPQDPRAVIELDSDNQAPTESPRMEASPPQKAPPVIRHFLDQFNVDYFRRLGMEWKPDVGALRREMEEDGDPTEAESSQRRSPAPKGEGNNGGDLLNMEVVSSDSDPSTTGEGRRTIPRRLRGGKRSYASCNVSDLVWRHGKRCRCYCKAGVVEIVKEKFRVRLPQRTELSARGGDDEVCHLIDRPKRGPTRSPDMFLVSSSSSDEDMREKPV